MFAPEIQILIPCHSLEDFPTEQNDTSAASLLNSFTVAYHPLLLAWTGDLPRWRRADDPPPPRRGQLVLIPTVSDDWLPHGWVEGAREAGAVVVSGLSDRQEMIEAALKVLDVDLSGAERPVDTTTESPPEDQALENEEKPSVLQDLIDDFLSLGTCWLLIELLTRRMRQFGNIDDSRFFQRAHAGAKAAIVDDRETADTHLRACFEMLLEARERFYPVDCYLLDLCLAIPDVDHDQLAPESRQNVPWSLMITANDLAAICEKQPDLEAAFAEACQSGRLSFVGGEDRETSLSLLPLESALFHFQRGRQFWKQKFGKAPTVWGRRQFGLSALLPQLLTKFGYKAALHVVLDDGIYPDSEYTKLRWRGVDGTLIDALSRIPLAADGAANFVRFPVRMAESMDHDQVAGLIMARWPKVATPWFHDLRRSQKYSPCLGRFVTLDHFFEQTELPGQLSQYKAGEYFSPLLIQHVARREAQPISRYSEHASRRMRFDTAVWLRTMAQALNGAAVNLKALHPIEDQMESIAPSSKSAPGSDEISASLSAELKILEESGRNDLSAVIMRSSGGGPGVLVFNPLSFARRVVVPLPDCQTPPAVKGAIKAVDYTAAHPEQSACIVEIPGCGYAWIPLNEAAVAPASPKLPLAEDGMLRNDLFEVVINEKTGGIGHIRLHNQRSKRLSQQLSFRFPRERTIQVGPDPSEKIKTQYAEMRCRGYEVAHRGTARGEIVTWGEIVDQAQDEKLASFRQTIRVWRALSTVEIEIELSDLKVPDGDPWNNYFASRFAWNDSTATVSRGIYHTAQGFHGERFEASDYVEIASEDERLTIVPHGLPFHRKSGDRMLDTLLVVGGESQRRFRFTIAVDSPYPLEAAWNATGPLPVIRTAQGPPRSGLTCWFFHLDGRHVQVTRLLETHDASTAGSPLEQFEHSTVPPDPGFALRLIETEGRAKPVRLRCFRRPTFARKRDFRGETIAELPISGDAVIIDIAAYEIADVELRFGST